MNNFAVGDTLLNETTNQVGNVIHVDDSDYENIVITIMLDIVSDLKVSITQEEFEEWVHIE